MARKNILAFTLMIVLVLSVLPIRPVYATQTAVFKVDSSSCKVGDTVTVKIDMLNAVDFAAGNFTIDYDSTKLKYISCVEGEVLLDNYMLIINPKESEGKIKVGYFANPEQNSYTKNAGNVLTLKFMAIDASKDESYVTLDVPTLKEESGEDVKVVSQKGTVTFLRPITSITINMTSVDLLKDERTQLSLSYEPKNTTDEINVVWRSSNTSVATVNNGIVEAVGDGEAIITAELAGFSKTCVVKVTDIDKIVENYEIDKNSENIVIGEEETISPLYIPETITDSLTIVWSTSDEDVAVVSDTGVVKAIGTGKATISLDINGSVRQCVVTVRSSEDDVIGDLDGNGVVDANDASVALELFKKGEYTKYDIVLGDLDNNNVIDANDASLILELFKTGE